MVQNAREKVARQDLRAKTLSVTTKNAEELQNAIEKANKLCLEDKGDLKFAHERLDLIQLQKGNSKIKFVFLFFLGSLTKVFFFCFSSGRWYKQKKFRYSRTSYHSRKNIGSRV